MDGSHKEVTLGIIGGSGLAELYGELDKSAGVITGQPLWYKSSVSHGLNVVFVSRHGISDGSGYRYYTAREVPYEDMIAFFAQQNVDAIISISATGSLDKDVKLADNGGFVLPSSYLRGFSAKTHSFADYRSSLRENEKTLETVLGHWVEHPPMNEPFNQRLCSYIAECGHAKRFTMYNGGLYILNHGNVFETPAEIAFLNLMLTGADLYHKILDEDHSHSIPHPFKKPVQGMFARLKDAYAIPGIEHLTRKYAQVGMTAMYEAMLAAEAGIAYASICVPVNYGAGMSKNPPSDAETKRVMGIASRNVESLLSGIISGFSTSLSTRANVR